MTGVRKVRMRTYLRTARTLSGVLRRGARPRLSGGAHGAQTHRSMRTPSAHPLGPVLALVATYPGPHPTTDDPASQAAYAEQVLAWLRHDHPDEWRDYLAHVARHLQQEGTITTSAPASAAECSGFHFRDYSELAIWLDPQSIRNHRADFAGGACCPLAGAVVADELVVGGEPADAAHLLVAGGADVDGKERFRSNVRKRRRDARRGPGRPARRRHRTPPSPGDRRPTSTTKGPNMTGNAVGNALADPLGNARGDARNDPPGPLQYQRERSRERSGTLHPGNWERTPVPLRERGPSRAPFHPWLVNNWNDRKVVR